MSTILNVPKIHTGEISKTSVRIPAWKSFQYTELRQISKLKDDCVYRTRSLELYLTDEQYIELRDRLPNNYKRYIVATTISYGNPDATLILYTPEDMDDLIELIVVTLHDGVFTS